MVDVWTINLCVVPLESVTNINVFWVSGELKAGSMVKTETVETPGPVVSVVEFVINILLGIVLSVIDASCETI